MPAEPAIRLALPEDAARLAELATQLGYPTSAAELAERLPHLTGDDETVVLVAASSDGDAIGWVHMELKRSLLSEPTAQVMGLIVDEAHRSGGVGARLLEAGERWAAERGCRAVLVGTRVTRERAHAFYRRQGYELLKTSHFFEKKLASILSRPNYGSDSWPSSKR
ncbi:MAG TPA: GNAT family N-acetyltransferase [Candidatus Limnocylindria bacterium]|nr:GNAT family N-acetyltransferase [Candidatus Limnocylindria bacterium]